ncbi:unnamed protein product, partial [marine sediment metagenome]
YQDKLASYDCKKLALDFTESCTLNCRYNYYEIGDNRLKEYFSLKGCKIEEVG